MKPPAPSSNASQQPTAQPGGAEESRKEGEPPVEGVIGQLEVYESGTVKMRLANGILLDVSVQASSRRRVLFL